MKNCKPLCRPGPLSYNEYYIMKYHCRQNLPPCKPPPWYSTCPTPCPLPPCNPCVQPCDRPCVQPCDRPCERPCETNCFNVCIDDTHTIAPRKDIMA